MKLKPSNDEVSVLKSFFKYLLLSFTLACGSHSDKEGPSTEPKLVFRLALELSSQTKIWEASNLFKQAVEEASPKHGIEKGEIKVEFFDQGMIGTERQLLEACYFGVIEVVQVNSSVVSSVVPVFSTLDLPYLFVNEDHLKEVLYGEIGNDLLDELQSMKMQGLGFYAAGFRNMFYKYDQPCADSPEALSGLKIRVMESPVMVNAINAVGPSAVPIPFSELYQSLKTGVVDGAENSASIFTSYNYYETGCNCFTQTEHFTNQHIMIANNEWLESLDEKYQARIKEVASEIVPEFHLIWDEDIKKAFSKMEEQGVEVNKVKDKRPFVDRSVPIHESFFKAHPEVSRSTYEKVTASAAKHLESE